MDNLFQIATPFLYTNYNHPTKQHLPAHLAHVVSWTGIETIVNAWNTAGKQKPGGWDLRPFAKYLFEVDHDACVYDPQNPTVCTLHNTILNLNGGALMKKNNQMRTKVLAEIVKHKPSIRKIKNLLNSAPANLRYGSTLRNTQIQGWLDPMGDNTKGLTTKEKSLIYITDSQCINQNVNNLIIPPTMNPPFDAYATYFKTVLVKKVLDPWFLQGTHYDPSPFERTTQNHIFQATNAADTKKLYVLSSSQAGYCPLRTLPSNMDQNTQKDTIKYYVKNF